jgi:hypothetical protein
MVDWDAVKTCEDLIVARMQQLDQQNLKLTQAAENLRNSSKANKAYFDSHQLLRRTTATTCRRSYSENAHKRLRENKLDDRWSGPYRIREIPLNSTYHKIEELDGI